MEFVNHGLALAEWGVRPNAPRRPSADPCWGGGKRKLSTINFKGILKEILTGLHARRSMLCQRSKLTIFDLSAAETDHITAANPNFAKMQADFKIQNFLSITCLCLFYSVLSHDSTKMSFIVTYDNYKCPKLRFDKDSEQYLVFRLLGRQKIKSLL